MAVNDARPHVLILPEDDANRQLANGFHLCVDSDKSRQMQVLPVARGWMKVLNTFESEHISEMDRCKTRFMVLLIDLDDDVGRLQEAMVRIPPRLMDRVFVLGARGEPEDIRREIGPYSKIGSELARDCREGTATVWNHELLRHNSAEFAKMRQHLRPILFA